MKAVDSKKDISWPSLTIQHPYDSLSKSVIWNYIVSSKTFFLFRKKIRRIRVDLASSYRETFCPR